MIDYVKVGMASAELSKMFRAIGEQVKDSGSSGLQSMFKAKLEGREQDSQRIHSRMKQMPEAQLKAQTEACRCVTEKYQLTLAEVELVQTKTIELLKPKMIEK